MKMVRRGYKKNRLTSFQRLPGNIAIAILFVMQIVIAELPMITSFTPARNALNVAKNIPLSITFDQDINQATLNNSTIKISGSLSASISGLMSYNSSTKTATITPASTFRSGDVITVTVTRGVKSMLGDSLAAAKTWEFYSANRYERRTICSVVHYIHGEYCKFSSHERF